MERWGKREIIFISLHCHHQNDSCIKMGSDESQFNVSVIVRDKVTRQCPQTTIFKEKEEPKQIRIEVPLLTSLTNALPLSQTGSLALTAADIDFDVDPTKKRLTSRRVNYIPRAFGGRSSRQFRTHRTCHSLDINTPVTSCWLNNDIST